MDLNAEQKRIATQEPKGHMLLKGVAGSGKTSVGIYRASFLLLNYCFGYDDAILLATYNRTLIHYMAYLYEKMDRIKNVEFSSLFEAPDDKIDIQTVDSLMFSFYREYSKAKGLDYKLGVSQAQRYEVINEGIVKLKKKYPDVAILTPKNMAFLSQEIDWIKDCLYLDVEAYQTADRKGLSRAQQDAQPQRLPKNSDTRKAIFDLMQFCDQKFHRQGMISFGDMRRLALKQAKSAPKNKYTHVIIDESQDLTRSQLLFLKCVYNEKDYASFCFISDTAQNIYPQSWIGSGRSYASIGFNMVGRSYSLSKNFRTTTQISRAAYSLIESCPDIVDDENFVKPALIDKQGDFPVFKAFDNESDQASFISQEIISLKERYPLGDIVVVARFRRQLEPVRDQLAQNGIDSNIFTDKAANFDTESVKLITMHSIKGLEFPLVFIIGLDERVMPYLTETDESARHDEAVKERKLFYVGMTRATEMLYLLCSSQRSEFLADISPQYLRTDRQRRIKTFYNIPFDNYRFGSRLTDKHGIEEKIRQWMISELLNSYGYPIDCLSIEYPVKCFSQKGFVDIAVQIEMEGRAVPFIFIETKRPGHNIEDALDQAKSYLSNCQPCQYGAATDGSNLVVIDRTFKPCKDLPVFRSSWGLSSTTRYTYTNFKTGLSIVVCYDPHQPDALELEVQGSCEFLDASRLEKLPMYGRIAAGQPIAVNMELDQDIFLPKEWVRGGSYFALRVRGDSMTGAGIDDGDLVVVRCQEAAENLDIAVVGVDDEGTLKRFSRFMGSNIILLSENPKYDPLLMNEEQVHVMGVAQGVIKWGAK